MKKAKIFLSAALAAAAVCSAAYAVTAVEDNTSSVESSDTSETSEAPETSNSDSDSDSGLTGNYVHLSIPRGVARIDFTVGDQLCAYPNIRAGARCAIPVGCSGTLTIDREGYIIISVKIGNSTSKRDMTKMSDGVYGFTILEGDTDMEVIFEGDNSETESSAPSTPKPVPTTPTRPTYPEPEPERYEPAETTTHESVPEADTNPDTGIALAIPAVALSAAAVIVATKKKK